MSKDILKDALEEFEQCRDAESDNRQAAIDDIEFALLDKQWPADARAQRELEGRPCLTINKSRQFVKNVVNSGRQNKPSIKVHPADSFADPATANIIDGLIRNIEYSSNADVAYDTGLEFAVAGGFGYWRVNMDYSHDDTFDMDLMIQRISNPFSVYGDPFSTSADSSDWNIAFITDPIKKDDFERKWKGAEEVDWSIGDYADLPIDWTDGDRIIVAERWKREQVSKKILKLSDGQIIGEKNYLENKDMFDVLGISVSGDRMTKGYKVTQNIMTGAEVLETNEWPGKYIPIVPVYGEEINIAGRRHLRSLIRSGKDAQMMFNFWRTATTEMIALAPKAPYIGAAGSFKTDADKWATANTETHAYIEYDVVPGGAPPTRQGFASPPTGALQEAMNASDDMKAIFGMYDASLGARSNETSGVAINQRKQQGELSNYHFLDNQARAIGHTGRILIDLIPHVYSQARVLRVMGEDKKPINVQVNQPIDGTGQMYNLALGKYDLTVSVGAGFASQREEAAAGMDGLLRAFPQSAPIIAPHLAKLQDWPEADKIAEELASLSPNANGKNPAIQQLQQQLQQQDQHAKEAVGQLQQQLQQAQKVLENKQQDNQFKAAELQIKERELAIKEQEARAKLLDAETKRLQVESEARNKLLEIQSSSQSPIEPQKQAISDADKLVFEANKEKELLQMKIDADREKQIRDLEAKQILAMQAKGGTDSMSMLSQQLQEVANIMSAEKELILDDDGKPIGSRIKRPNAMLEIQIEKQAPSGAFLMPDENQESELEQNSYGEDQE